MPDPTPFNLVLSYLRLLPVFVRLARRESHHDRIFMHTLEYLQKASVDRDGFLKELCKGQRVLHFGFVDSPFSVAKIKSGLLLHQKLQAVAQFIYGVDIDAQSIEQYRELTGDNNNSVLDVEKPLSVPSSLDKNFQVILFGEILEHLLRPAVAMSNLLLLCQQNPGARLCITVPNAYSVTGFFTALSGKELVHPDHYYYFSPVTLRKLIQDSGFKLLEMRQYGEPVTFSCPGVTKNGLIAICAPASST